MLLILFAFEKAKARFYEYICFILVIPFLKQRQQKIEIYFVLSIFRT